MDDVDYHDWRNHYQEKVLAGCELGLYPPEMEKEVSQAIQLADEAYAIGDDERLFEIQLNINEMLEECESQDKDPLGPQNGTDIRLETAPKTRSQLRIIPNLIPGIWTTTGFLIGLIATVVALIVAWMKGAAQAGHIKFALSIGLACALFKYAYSLALLPIFAVGLPALLLKRFQRLQAIYAIIVVAPVGFIVQIGLALLWSFLVAALTLKFSADEESAVPWFYWLIGVIAAPYPYFSLEINERRANVGSGEIYKPEKDWITFTYATLSLTGFIGFSFFQSFA